MRRVLAYGAALTLLAALLAGCGGSKKVAAHVNKQIFTEEDFLERCENVVGSQLFTSQQRGGPAKAGEFAMRQMIMEAVLLQLAESKKVAPTDAQVTAYLAFAKQYPQIAGQIAVDPTLTDSDRRRQARTALAEVNIEKQPLNLTQADLQGAYDQIKAQVAVPDKYHVRLVDVTTKAKAQQALDLLKKNVSFETVAMQLSENPAAKTNGGDFPEAPANAMPPSMVAAIQNLQPNQYTPQPVTVKDQQGKTHYVIVQMVSKTPGRVPTLDDVRPVVEQYAVRQKDPNVAQRIETAMRDAIKSADIQISLKPYEDVGKKLKDEAAKAPQQPGLPPGSVPPPGAGGAPGGAPGGPAPGGAPTGATPPR